MKVKTIFFVLVGLLSMALSICCFNLEVGDKVSMQYFGGDAYTGMQQASAHAANNILLLAKIVKIGFGSLLLILGLGMIALGLTFYRKTPEYVEHKTSEDA